MDDRSSNVRVASHLIHNGLVTVAFGLLLAALFVATLMMFDIGMMSELLPEGVYRQGYELNIIDPVSRQR